MLVDWTMNKVVGQQGEVTGQENYLSLHHLQDVWGSTIPCATPPSYVTGDGGQEGSKREYNMLKTINLLGIYSNNL